MINYPGIGIVIWWRCLMMRWTWWKTEKSKYKQFWGYGLFLAIINLPPFQIRCKYIVEGSPDWWETRERRALSERRRCVCCTLRWSRCDVTAVAVLPSSELNVVGYAVETSCWRQKRYHQPPPEHTINMNISKSLCAAKLEGISERVDYNMRPLGHFFYKFRTYQKYHIW